MDNFENQDLGGLPILKKETPSQEKDLGGLPILKKKEPTLSGFSGTPSTSPSRYIEKQDDKKFGYWDQLKVDRGYKPLFQTTPIASAVKKDTQKDENLAAGIYNTLVGSVKRLAGGAAYMAEVGGLVSGGRPEFAITRLANAENVRQKTEQFVEKARSEKSSKGDEQAMGKYDFTPEPGGGLLSGVDANDFKALAFTAPSQALDMVLGSLTYGSSFVAQSVSDAANELNESDAGKKLNDPQKAIYIFTQAAVQAALEKLSLDLILKNTGLGKIAKRKIANEITDEFVNKGIKATAKDIEEAAFKKASTFANKVKRVGFKAASGVVTEGTTEGTQTAAQEGIKLLTNKIVDKDVFDEEDIIANLGKNIINATIGGGAFGTAAGGGVGVFQNTNKAIRDEVAKAGKKYFVNDTEVSEAEFNAATGNKKVVSDITKIQDEISKQVEEGNITPQEAQAANITAQQYAEIAGKIPTTVSPQDKYKIIGGIEQREALNARKQQAYDELTNLDPVFRKEKQDQIDLIQAKIDETNDYLEGIVSGKKPEYKEKRGMYFKVDSEGNETPINKETYDLAKSIREEDERKAKEPVDTTPAVIMPEENVAPQVVEPSKGAAVIMPEENVPAETTVISPEQQGKGAAVIMPEANVAPEVAETVVTEEVAPTEVKAKPEVKSKLQDYKQKFSSIDLLKNPSKESIDKFIEGYDFSKGKMSYENIQEAPSGLSDQEVKKFNVENSTNPKELVEIYLSEPKESKLSAKEEVIAEGLSKVTLSSFKRFGDKNLITGGMARTYFNKGAKGIDVRAQELSKELDIQPKDIVDFMVKYPSGASAALRSGESDVAYAAAMKFQDLTGLRMSDRVAKKISDKDKAPKEKTEIEFDEEETAPIEGGFVPFVEGEEELPFAVQEATTEEVGAMQDIVKDYIDDGTTSLSEIKKAIAKELGYNTKKLRQTIEDAYTKYTTTEEAAVIEVKSGLLGRIGNAFGKMFGKEAQKPFISKDGKALVAKAKNVAETGGRVSFQATLGNGETVTAKPVDASVVNGFYSPLELQINQMKQDKMPAKQWVDKLRGEEAKWTGLSDWLTQQEGSLTKENIKNWLQDNQIEINEIVKGNKDITNEKNWDFDAIGDGVWKKTLDNGDEVVFDASEGSGTVIVFINSNEIGIVNYDIKFFDRSEIFEKVLDQGFIDQYLNLSDGLSSTKYGKYTLEGDKEDYKEILITYPTPPKNLTFDEWNEKRKSWGEEEGTLEVYKKTGILYKSNHFDEKNILVHVRSDLRTDAKGNKIYFIEEVQSDWGQEGKKKGFYDLTDNELKRFNELKPVMPILSDAQQNAHQAFFYAYKYDVSTSLEEFYKLPVQERKNKINETHNKYQERTNNYIASIQKAIDDRNKQISDKIDEGLLLEQEELKYDKALKNAKNNKVIIYGKEIDLNIKKEYDAYNNKLKQLDEEIKDFNRESVKLEEENGIYSKQIDNLNKDKQFDDSEYIFAIKNSELTFDKNEYDKIRNEFNELENKIKVASINKAPFVTKTNDWAKLGLKVALKNAVQAGATKIAWTNGEQQNERYDLSKQVDYIEKIKESDINKENNQFQVDINFPAGMINLFVNKDTNKIDYYLGNRIGDLADKDLSDVIGKDMADKIIEGEFKKYEGDGLRIGGKGMKGFYGSPKENNLGILGDLAKSLYKQTPEKLILDNYREEKLKSLQAELDEYSANKTSDFRMRDFYLEEAQGQKDKEEKELMLLKVDYHEKRAKNNAELEESVLREIKRLGIEYQYSINITPELKAQVEVGLPLFMADTNADLSREKEKQKIIDKAKQNGTFMKAPNGKKSNLNEEQWASVRTKEFKNWFGDWENNAENASKVVDKNGEPRVVFHGTNEKFDAFSKEKLGSKNWLAESAYAGFFFAGNKKTSEAYTGMNNMDFMGITISPSKDIQVIIDKYEDKISAIKKDISNVVSNEVLRWQKENDAGMNKIIETLTNEGKLKDIPGGIDNLIESVRSSRTVPNVVYKKAREINVENGNEEKLDKVANARYKEIEEVWKKKNDKQPKVLSLFLNIKNPYEFDYKDLEEDGGLNSHIEEAKLKGNDGVVFKNIADGADVDDIFVAFDSNQIKSAEKNIGTYSADDDRINFMSDSGILGFSFANRMYLNGEKLNPNTIIHEAGHIWTEWVKNNDYNVYAKGMELVEKSPYLQKAKNSKFYQEQAAKLGTEQEKEEYFKHEALAMAIGDKGAQFVVESKKDAFKDWLKTLWNKIKSLTGFKDLTEEQFQNLTFEEFSKMAVKEILGVENDLDKFQAVRSMKKKKDFVKGKVRGEANKRAIDDFEVDDMVKLIKADYDLQTLKNIKDAIQKRSAEEILPSQPRKTREARGERKRVEPRVEGDEVTGEDEDAQPEDVKEGDKKGWNGAITIAANEDRRLLLGLPEYESERQSFEKWTDEAIRMLKRGYNVDKLLDKMQKGEVPTPVENQIRKIYVAKLKQDYLDNPSAELEKKLIKYTQLNDIANSQAGRALRSLADVADPRETLADFVISKMEANNVDELTEKQREQVKKQYEEVKKKEEDVEAKLEINDELNIQLLAETVFKEEKAKRKPYQKTKDYKADRKYIIDSIKKKWKDKDKPTDVLMALPFPVPTKKAQQLIAIAPDVSKLMSSYIEEGVDDLKEIVSRIYVDLRNEIDGLSEKDIFDVIAGRYKKEKPLLSQLQFKKAELRKEAELIAKIEDIMDGNMPTSEKAKIEQNQKLTQLRNELRDLKKEVGFYDLSKINSLKEKNLEKIKELDEKIQKGDFEKAIKTPSFLENPEFKKKYPKEYDAYLQSVKELTDKKHEFEVSIAEDELKGLTFRQKLVKRWGPEFKNTLSAIKATADNSFIFIQLGPAIWQNPLLLPKVLNEQRKVIFNEGRFRKEIVQIFENKELANLIEVSGLDILDPQTLRESLREEQLGGTDFLERSVEIKGKKYSLATIVKAPFERIAIAAGNYVRLKLFLESVSHLEAQGKTIETHEKEFKDAARVANELTSRGEMSEEFKTGKLKTLSSLMWAPKMISSTLNLLGIGDAYNWALGRKGYYASLSPELRKVAIAKMATAITVPYLVMAAIALDDDFEVDYDPRSVTFGQLKQISTGKSWNPYGRFTSIVRYLILMMLGVRYIGDEKMRADFKTETFKFFRGKMAPAYGLGLDMAFREGFDGQPLSFNDVAQDAVTPLALKDLKTYMEDDGTWGLITQGLPAITGIKVGTEKQFNQAKQPLEDVIKKHARTDDTYYSFELKNPTTKEIATKEQFNKFVKERDRLIAEKLTDLYNGYVITDSPNPVPFVSLEANEASKQISTAKTESTKEAKEIVFGKKKKTVMERLIERKRRMLRR